MTGEAMDCDVLVVGLGPVGATLTALLARRGLSVIAIERDAEVYPLPRAVHFDHEIMRILQQLDLVDAAPSFTRPVPDYEFRTADGRLLVNLPPARETPSGWASGYMFHQPSLDGLLRETIASEPSADVRLGWRLDGFVQDEDAVSASVTGPTGETVIRARYIVGCDGAWSPVREAIGGGLFDYAFDEPWLVVDVKVGDGARMPDANIQLCDPARPTTCVFGGPGRHRWEFMLSPDERPEAMQDEAVIRRLIEPWDCGPVEIERSAVYRFHGLVANRWRSARALIAGDAAHQTPPFAGQGMCAGLRDAANLAWKLDAVLAGGAREALLDTYQAEREPHVRAAIELAIGMGRIVCLRDPRAAAERDASMLDARARGAPALPPVRPSAFAAGCLLAGSPGAGTVFPQPTCGEGGEQARLDDALGQGAWLITRAAPTCATPALEVVPLDAVRIGPFRPALEAWLDRRAVDAVLVRPDRYVFGTGAPDELAMAWAVSLGLAEARA